MTATLRRDPRPAAFAILWILLLTFGPRTMLQDPGTFWHVVVGQQMLADRAVVNTDSFTMTHAGDEWLAQQWLGECAMALAHRAAGLDGVVLLAATLIAVTLALIYGRFTRARLNAPAAIALVVLVIGASSYHYIPRPHLASIAGMALLMLVLTDVETGRASSTRLWLLPPGFLIWVNVHGGALGGIATLVLFTVVYILRGRGRHHAKPLSLRTLAAVTCLSAATVLVNPFGPSLPSVWLSLMNSDVLPAVIIEHAPPGILSPEGLMITSLGAAYVLTLIAARHAGLRITWLLSAVWLVFALSRVRHGPLFAVAAAVTLADMIPHVAYWQRWRRESGSTTPAATFAPTDMRTAAQHCRFACIVGSAFCGALLLQSAGIVAPIVGAGRCQAAQSDWPVSAVAALREDARAQGLTAPRIFNDMRFGGYLIYTMPDAAIYIDDRCELHRDWGLLRYIELQQHPQRLAGEAARYGFDYALVESGSPLCRYLAEDCGWLLLHSDLTASMFRARHPMGPRAAIAQALH